MRQLPPGNGLEMLAWWNSLKMRHSSQPDDIPSILANLLGLKVYNVSSTETPVVTVIANLGSIPFGLLYNTGPRFNPAVQASGNSIRGSIPLDHTLSPHQDANTTCYSSFILTNHTNHNCNFIVNATFQPDDEIANAKLRTASLGLCFLIDKPESTLGNHRNCRNA